jgi:YegS/Rv2252/BmrU family lipid kinase
VKKVTMIVNPVSGRGRAGEAARTAAQVLRSAGVEVHIHETRRAGEGTERAAELARSVDALVAVGGDGTLGEIVEGVRGQDVVLGLVPVGTANVVARDLRIPRNPRKSAGLLVQGTPRALDVGEVNGRLFLAMVGVGFDGEIVKNIAAARNGPISMATYVKPTLRTLRTYRPEILEVEVDGHSLPGATYGIIISNTRNYGGLFSVTPDARISDGWLDYQQRVRPGWIPIVRCGISAALRARAPASVARYGRGRRFIVRSRVPVAVQVDGDPFGTTPLDIQLHEKAVRILAGPVPAAAGVSS